MIAIIIGSRSDIEIIEETEKVLKEFKIPYELTIASCHRSPEKLREYVKGSEERIEVFICAAGMAAHLPGVVASFTIRPVIGVPIPNSPLCGQDALYSMVQMPCGLPVAVMAIGRHGAKNAGILAAQILALKDEEISKRLKIYKDGLASDE